MKHDETLKSLESVNTLRLEQGHLLLCLALLRSLSRGGAEGAR